METETTSSLYAPSGSQTRLLPECLRHAPSARVTFFRIPDDPISPSVPTAPAVIRSARRLFRRSLPAEHFLFSCGSCLCPGAFTTGCRKNDSANGVLSAPLSFPARSNRLSPAPPPPSSLIRKQNSSLFLLFSLTYFKTSRIKRKS